MIGRSSRKFGNVREANPDVREWSGGPLRSPGVVGKPTRLSGGGQEALPDVLEWSVGQPLCPVVVGRPSGMSGSGRGGPLGCSGLDGRSSWKFGSGREDLPDVLKW